MEPKKAINLQSERDEAFPELDIDKITTFYAGQGMLPASSEVKKVDKREQTGKSRVVTLTS